MQDITAQLTALLESTRIHVTDELPADWYERHMVMPRSNSIKGPYSYDWTPYWREVANRAYKYDPARKISVQKGAQVGFTTGVLLPFQAYVVSQDPGPMILLTGNSELTQKFVKKTDVMLQCTGLKKHIQPAVIKARNNKTGDTDHIKEFANGSIEYGSMTNHNIMRQQDYRFGGADDTDAARASKTETGSFMELLEQRFASHVKNMKLFISSTPQLKASSIIEAQFMLGDQRYYNVPCPCCHELIVLKWKVQIDERETGGIHYELDNQGSVIDSSVGYVCQKCSGFFKNSAKHEMNLNGLWVPTATPLENDHYSYHLSSLYAPISMYDWTHYAKKYVSALADPIQRVARLQTHHNLCLGETFEEVGEPLDATALMSNVRPYEIGIIPDLLSRSDGNGEIILVTLAADMNGKVDDARIDYEVLAHSESGTTYSITHGSIGTFIPREGQVKEEKKVEREHWTYRHGHTRCVWEAFAAIIRTVYPTQSGARQMIAAISGIDSGFLNEHAYPFVERCAQDPTIDSMVIALKTKDQDQFTRTGIDESTFAYGKERSDLYIVRSNRIKDGLAARMRLQWDRNDEHQPPGFMNYPAPVYPLYQYDNFFSHYEAEEYRTTAKPGRIATASWQKKDSAVQNHLWDCRVYNIVCRDIWVATSMKQFKLPKATWSDYVDFVRGAFTG